MFVHKANTPETTTEQDRNISIIIESGNGKWESIALGSMRTPHNTHVLFHTLFGSCVGIYVIHRTTE